MRCSADSGLAATVLAVLLLLSAGVAAVYQATMGFNVVSTEAGRRLAVSLRPLTLPPAAVHAPDADGLARLLARDGRVALVSFFYSSCNAICSASGNLMQQMQQTIIARGLGGSIRLLSISFDPADSPAVLAAYARRQHADPALWRMVSVDQAAERTALLQAFGVVALKIASGEYQHNAAFHVLDRRGRLVRIMDISDADAALAAAVRLAQETAREG